MNLKRTKRVVDRVAWMMELLHTRKPKRDGTPGRKFYTKSEAAALAFPSATRHKSLARAGDGFSRYQHSIREKLEEKHGADRVAEVLIQGTQAFQMVGLKGEIIPDFTERRLAATDIARIYGELNTGNVNNFYGDEFTLWLVEQMEMAKRARIEKPMEVQAEIVDAHPRADRPDALALQAKSLPAPEKAPVFATPRPGRIGRGTRG